LAVLCKQNPIVVYHGLPRQRSGQGTESKHDITKLDSEDCLLVAVTALIRASTSEMSKTERKSIEDLDFGGNPLFEGGDDAVSSARILIARDVDSFDSPCVAIRTICSLDLVIRMHYYRSSSGVAPCTINQQEEVIIREICPRSPRLALSLYLEQEISTLIGQTSS